MTLAPDQLTAARHALADLDVTIADLHDANKVTPVPTLGEYLPTVIAAAGSGATAPTGPAWRSSGETLIRSAAVLAEDLCRAPGAGSWPGIAKILGVSVGRSYNHIPDLKELRNSRVSR